MRAIAVYFGVIAMVIWMASDGQIDRITSRFGIAVLPSGHGAPIEIPLDSLPDPQDLNSLSIVAPAQASTLSPAKVVASVVNLRAGPGLSYRMVDVAARGETLLITGQWIDGWAPITTADGEQTAWVHGNYISAND